MNSCLQVGIIKHVTFVIFFCFTFISPHLLYEKWRKKIFPEKISVLWVIWLILFILCFPFFFFKLGFFNELLKIWFTQNKRRAIHPEKTVKLFCLSRLHCESPAWGRELRDRPLCGKLPLPISEVGELLRVVGRRKGWTHVNSMNINQLHLAVASQ